MGTLRLEPNKSFRGARGRFGLTSLVQPKLHHGALSWSKFAKASLTIEVFACLQLPSLFSSNWQEQRLHGLERWVSWSKLNFNQHIGWKTKEPKSLRQELLRHLCTIKLSIVDLNSSAPHFCKSTLDESAMLSELSITHLFATSFENLPFSFKHSDLQTPCQASALCSCPSWHLNYKGNTKLSSQIPTFLARETFKLFCLVLGGGRYNEARGTATGVPRAAGSRHGQTLNEQVQSSPKRLKGPQGPWRKQVIPSSPTQQGTDQLLSSSQKLVVDAGFYVPIMINFARYWVLCHDSRSTSKVVNWEGGLCWVQWVDRPDLGTFHKDCFHRSIKFSLGADREGSAQNAPGLKQKLDLLLVPLQALQAARLGSILMNEANFIHVSLGPRSSAFRLVSGCCEWTGLAAIASFSGHAGQPQLIRDG